MYYHSFDNFFAMQEAHNEYNLLECTKEYQNLQSYVRANTFNSTNSLNILSSKYMRLIKKNLLY